MAPDRSKTALVLAGDIGGTKTRLGIFSRGKTRPVKKTEKTFESRRYPDLEAIVAEFMRGKSAEIAAACFGIAGPVVDGKSRTTNLPWSVAETRLSRRFSWPKVRLVNDLVATALSVSVLRADETQTLLGGKRGTAGNRIVVAPGTGLGLSMLVSEKGGEEVTVASEGGHADFAPVSEDQVDLWRFLHRRYGHVSAERVLSGGGLVNIYAWLKTSGRKKEPAWLAREMENEDTDPAETVSRAAAERHTPIAVAALRQFSSILGAVAGNLALTALATGGVYLGGGIPPKIRAFLREKTFAEAFLAKGRFRDLLRQVPVKVIVNDRAALIGAARCAAAEAS
jgi:glucokinase